VFCLVELPAGIIEGVPDHGECVSQALLSRTESLTVSRCLAHRALAHARPGLLFEQRELDCDVGPV
jgi:hypothetical protein